MAENNQESSPKQGLLKRFLKAVFGSPVNSLFILLLLYFGAKAYVFDGGFTTKMIVLGLAGLWIFWLIARYMVILFVCLVLLGAGAYIYYDYSQQEVRKCETAGGWWNSNTKTCEAKTGIWDKVKKLYNDYKSHS